MRLLDLAGVAAGAFVLASCASTTEWVNTKNRNAEYAADYNRCEMSSQQDPKVQSGAKALLLRQIDRCMAKEGWILVEKP